MRSRAKAETLQPDGRFEARAPALRASATQGNAAGGKEGGASPPFSPASVREIGYFQVLIPQRRFHDGLGGARAPRMGSLPTGNRRVCAPGGAARSAGGAGGPRGQAGRGLRSRPELRRHGAALWRSGHPHRAARPNARLRPEDRLVALRSRGEPPGHHRGVRPPWLVPGGGPWHLFRHRRRGGRQRHPRQEPPRRRHLRRPRPPGGVAHRQR